jgi:DNA invertase Pin-like site-specific DNA recombinase
MESGVKFVAADMPEANETMLHFRSVMAQHEAKAISLRTKAALAAAKARGTKLGDIAGQLIRSLENAADKLKSTKVTSCSCVLSTSEK